MPPSPKKKQSANAVYPCAWAWRSVICRHPKLTRSATCGHCQHIVDAK